jgi:hypothetical protein
LARKLFIVEDSNKNGFISVESYEDKRPRGRVFFPAFMEELPFNSAMQMLDAVADCIDRLGYVGESCELRSFAAGGGSRCVQKPLPLGGLPPREEVASFRIRIIFMQNASWQGTVYWEQGNEEQSFRSVFELLSLMDSALCSSK